jgi:hypothetical protein
MMTALPERKSRRLVCQFGLSRAGLYAVADWYLYGISRNTDTEGGGEPKCQQFRAACLDDISIPEDCEKSRFVTLESLRLEVLRDGLGRAVDRGATAWIQLRDPYNWFASLQQGVRTGVVMWRHPVNLEKWKDYARLCCATHDWLSYNRWFAESEYRRALATEWGFSRNRDGQPWLRIPTAFVGSSFDDRRYQERAQYMDVLGRYRQFVSQQWWRDCFDDETIALSEQLFGMKRPW